MGDKRIDNESYIRIGPKLKSVLEKQKKNISDVTEGVVDASDWEAGELIAKKIEDNELL